MEEAAAWIYGSADGALPVGCRGGKALRENWPSVRRESVSRRWGRRERERESPVVAV